MAAEVEDIFDPLRQLWRLSVLELNQLENPSEDTLAFSSKKADTLRSMLIQLHFAQDSNRLSGACFHELLMNYMKKYSTIVDDFMGLNNYSEEALHLATKGGYRNDSGKWVSSFLDASAGELQSYLPVSQKKLKVRSSTFETAFEKAYKEQNLKIEPFNDINNKSFEKTSDQSVTKTYINEMNADKKIPSPMNKVHSNLKEDMFSSSPSHRHFVRDNNQMQKKKNADWSNNQSNGFLKRDEESNKSINACIPNQKRKHSTDNTTSNKPSNMAFQTAKEKLVVDSYQKQGGRGSLYGTGKKSLGSRRDVTAKFVPPVPNRSSENENKFCDEGVENKFVDEHLKNIDPKMIELMKNEIMDHGPPVTWEDIAGLKFAKTTIQEIVVWPLLRPDLFIGLRGPPKGILLFGPPGTGKTLIGKCIASQSRSTFFCISASSLTSKWVGEGEKLVRALFAVARCHQPAVIFIDEIDSLLTQRSDSEHESSRRIKTEFLVQLDGAATATDERLLIVGATNRPQELDEAARRRLVKRLYIPLPDGCARKQIVSKLVSANNHCLSEEQLELICKNAEGYSGADMANLCKEAALGPIRDLNFADIERIMPDQVRPINLEDFMKALKQVRASVSDKDLEIYLDWNKKYGSGGF